jgi:hypothetical protein
VPAQQFPDFVDTDEKKQQALFSRLGHYAA